MCIGNFIIMSYGHTFMNVKTLAKQGKIKWRGLINQKNEKEIWNILFLFILN